MSFTAQLAKLPIAVQDDAVTLKGFSQDGGRADFSKNLLVSLFNDDQSNEPNFWPDPSRWTVTLNNL